MLIQKEMVINSFLIFLILATVGLSIEAIMAGNVAVAKKHHSNNDETITSNEPLPTIDTTPPGTKDNGISQDSSSIGSSPPQSSFDSIADLIDNKPNSPLVFVGNIVKKMSDGTQLHIMGEVQNVGNKSLGLVEIITTFYDSSNKTIGNYFTNPMPASLEPQQTAPFDLVVPDYIPASDIASIKYHISGFNPSKIFTGAG
jgi:hypothetical protein